MNTEDALANAMAILPPELNDTAFAVASDIIMSDGKITKKEEEMLNLLARKLSIKKEIAKKIVEVMTIKNKG